MEAEHFDDVIRKKLEQIQPPAYSENKWAAVKNRIVVPSRFDYKGAIAACSLLLNVLLVWWLWQTVPSTHQNVNQRQLIAYDTVSYRTVVYDTIHRTVYQYEYQTLNTFVQANRFAARDPKASRDHQFAATTLGVADMNPEQLATSVNVNTVTEANRTPVNSSEIVLAHSSEEAKNPIEIDSAQNDPVKKDSIAVAKDEKQIHQREYRQRRELFITPTLTLPVVNIGDAEKTRSNLIGLELSYMPFNRVGFFGKVMRYKANYSVVDEQFRVRDGSGGYGPGTGTIEYEYVNSSISKTAWAYNIGARAIVFRERYWQVIADVGFGKFFNSNINVSNRLREVSTGKYVFSEPPSQQDNGGYLLSSINIERSIGYRVRLRFGIELAKNMQTHEPFDKHVLYWTGFSTGLSYQLK